MMKRVGRTVLGVRMGCHALSRCCLKAVSACQERGRRGGARGEEARRDRQQQALLLQELPATKKLGSGRPRLYRIFEDDGGLEKWSKKGRRGKEESETQLAGRLSPFPFASDDSSVPLAAASVFFFREKRPIESELEWERQVREREKDGEEGDERGWQFERSRLSLGKEAPSLRGKEAASEPT